ncbi:MAG TPA: VWA domain-containing protein [Pirellulales bacterium]|nr:VWA domain-containing protein [Pirellulales bacterium]
MIDFIPITAFLLHPAMLFWAAAAGVPIVIHLLSKRKYREVQWAAMQYLLAAVRKNSRRLLVEQWILLALRTAVILLAVMAVAEPGCEQAGLSLTGNERAHKVIVVDGSFSMAYKPTEKTRFDRAKELAARIVEESNQGDGFTLVLMASPPRVIVGKPAFEHRDFLEEIENLKLWHGGADLPATLAVVEEVLATARREHPRLTRNEVFFLTDLARNTWSPPRDPGDEFRARSTRLASSAQLVVLDLGQTGSENAAVVQLQLADSLATVARDATLEAEVRNFGRSSRERQLVECFVDGRKVAQEYVDLAPHGQATVAFPYRFDTSGDHAVEIRLAPDLLSIDNHRWLTATVKDQLAVLCVSGKPAGGFQGATDYLAVALAPDADEDQRGLVRTDVVPESALLEVDLGSYDCVFLTNVGQFTGSEAAVLASYLKHGGGIVCFLGDQVHADSYNRRLTGQSSDGAKVLPASLAELMPQGMYFFNPLNYQHPLLNVFRDQEQAGLLTTPVTRYYKLNVAPDSLAKVALAFENGDPAIIEEPIDRGRSILVATSADVSWSAMPLWPSFPPIVHELLQLAVAGQSVEHNAIVGQAVGDSLAGQASRGQVHITPPSGEAMTARLVDDGSDTVWSFAETAQSGVYTAQVPGGRKELFSVNLDTSESDLTKLDPSELADRVWSGIPFVHRTDWQDPTDSPIEGVVRRQWLHIYLLAAAMVLLVLETILSTWFGTRSA